MSAQRPLLVGVEDLATAGIVGVEAAHVAMANGIDHLVLFHVLDAHPTLNAVFGMANYAAPINETPDDAEAILGLAEAALRAEYAALQRQAPRVDHMIGHGQPGLAIQEAATDLQAAGIVLGHRRPHAFGRLTHPDVRAHLAGHSVCPLYLASLQAPDEQ